jgi:hypothetical protein
MNFPAQKPATEQNTIDTLTSAALSFSSTDREALLVAKRAQAAREQAELEATEKILNTGRK